MGIPPNSYLGPGMGLGPGRRRVGADGLIQIVCKICEKTIAREMYRGFSTAICAVCNEELERGKTAQEIMESTRVREQKAAEEVFDDIGSSNFKAIGIGQRLKEVVQGVKKAAQGRRRKPLFASKDRI